MEWKEVLLGELVDIYDSKRIPLTSQEREKIKGDIPYYGAQGIIDYINQFLFDGEYILIAEDGNNIKSRQENIAQIAKGKFWVNNHAHILQGKIEQNLLCYIINHTDISGYVTGSAQPKLNQANLLKIPIKIPVNLSDQRKIVGILSALDSKIENNNKINANLEAQAQALFKSWFVDFTPFKDQPFVDSELGPIPQGWKVGKLGDIALQSTEKVLTRNDVKVLSPITTGKLVLSEEYFTKQVFSKSIRNYKIVKQGAFAYNPARVNIGSLGMNEFKFDGCVSPVYVVFECLKGYSFFFDLFRKTEFFKQAVISFAIGGVRQTLNYSDFALIDATIPPLNIVQSFNEIYLHLKKKISINEKENQRLAALRDTLLPKLMSGEIKL